MSFYDKSTADQYEALATRQCRNCGQASRNLQDGWCPRCNGEDSQAETRAANLRAWEKFYQSHPEMKR